MEKEKINPISGDQFEDFLLLTDPREKSSKTKKAWQKLQQQINAHDHNANIIDLNRICVDMIKMELLIFYQIIAEIRGNDRYYIECNRSNYNSINFRKSKSF